MNYAALARLTRDGGFVIVLVIRLSGIPSHFSTAVFATCDVKFWHFFVATFASLPKQIVLVYLGVLLIQNENETKENKWNKDKIIKNVMFGFVGLITVALGVWIYYKMRKVKKILLDEQEQRRMKRAERIEMVPDIKTAFQRRYDEEPAGDWQNAQPMQPTRMV